MTATTKPRRGRPFGVWVLIVMQALSLLVTGITLAAVLVALSGRFEVSELNITGSEMLLLVVQFLLSAASVIGLLLMRRWAWYLTMFDLGISMVIGLYFYYTGAPDYVSMLINVIVVLYLNQRDVQKAFQPRKRKVESQPVPVRGSL